MGMQEPNAEFDGRKLRDTVGRFATGVTIITGRSPEGVDVGLTANSFTSVSLDPPLVLFCLAKSATSVEAYGIGCHFAVNVLSNAQQDLSNRFAKSNDDKFSGLTTERWSSGAPILPDCLANLECTTEQQVDAGDHLVIIGRVIGLRTAPDTQAEKKPLLFFGGAYAQLG